MPLTSKGKRWELLHSLWIGWALLTLGLFSWIAFVYIGFRAQQRKWYVWGAIYSTPFVLMMFSVTFFGEAGNEPAWLTNLGTASLLIVWPVSVFHAFWRRKEYLLRLEALQGRKGESDRLLKRRLAAEYGGEAQQDGFSGPVSAPSVAAQAVPDAEGGSPSPKDFTLPDRPAQTWSDERGQSQPLIPEKKPVVPPDILSKDELEYRISSSYPFPLAFGFRSLASIVDHRDLYREQLRVAENMLAFLSSVSLALLREEDRKKAAVNPRDYWLTGISPGDWKDIVGRCSKVFADYEDDSLALNIKELNIRSEKKEGFGANVAALIKVKNDYKHDRGPVVLEDIAEASREAQERLKRCMAVLEFLTAYPIRQVEDFDIARRGGGVTLKCLRYTGDHPSFPQEEVFFDRALPRGDLFLDLGQRGWAPLFPFVTTMTCSHCKVRETYFIDAWDTRRNIARLKSFERGHTATSTEVSEALSEWTSNAHTDTA